MCYISGGHEKSCRVVVLWSVVRALLWSWYGFDTVDSCLLAKYWKKIWTGIKMYISMLLFSRESLHLLEKCVVLLTILLPMNAVSWRHTFFCGRNQIFSSKWKSFEILFSLTFHFLKVSLFTKVISHFLSIKPHDLRFHFHKSVSKYYTLHL